MCFSCVVDMAESQLDQQKTPLGVAVQFSGHLSGSLELWASQQFASSMAINFLGSSDDSDTTLDNESMLDELANMMCGATLTQLYGDGEFRLESPVAITRDPGLSMHGQEIESDDGSMWVFFEVGPNRWKAKAQSEF
jgi:chemotaxis protein CheY-P-specific phosphatase CheC